MPLISVCVIVYNLENYIETCLKSLLKQNFEDFELLVVDNGSSDGSIQICEKYKKLFRGKMRFQKLPKPTVPARAHAYANREAIGDYIHIVDGDDYLREDYLQDIAHIIEREKPELIMGRFECVIEKGAQNYLDVEIDASKINGVETERAIRYLFLLPYFNRYVWRFIVNRRLLALTNFDTETAHLIVADNIKSTIWLLNTRSIHYIDKPFYYYRMRKGSTVNSRNNKMTIDLVKGVVKLIDLILKGFDELELQDKMSLQAQQFSWFLRLFISQYDFLDYASKDDLCGYIRQKSCQVVTNKIIENEEVRLLFQQIESYEGVTGLDAFVRQMNNHFVELIRNDRKYGKYYVYPAGNYGLNTKRILENEGKKVIGFLDNDVMKNGTTIEGCICKLPEEANLSDSKSGIVISTVYDKLIPEFKKKLEDNQVDGDRIIVRRTI